MASSMLRRLATRWTSAGSEMKYVIVGGAFGLPVGVGSGISALADGFSPNESTSVAVLSGGMACIVWPVVIVYGLFYIPIKGLHVLTAPRKQA
jgi:hypothetical protein